MEHSVRLGLVRSLDRQEAVRAELGRILSSRLFQSSERLSRFLEFIVGETLAGRQEAIKEYAIGVQVCDRGQDFDPRIDPIVRIDARRLRSRLREYYATEGAGSSMRITLATGSYIPSFDAQSPVRPAQVKTAAGHTVAVLPLESGVEDEALASGLTEGIIATLAGAAGLHVVARTSAFVFRGVARDIREIGEVLNASAILEGHVQRAGNQYRISLRLVDAASGLLLWSEVFDRPGGFGFQLQDEIGEAVGKRLGLVEWPRARRPRKISDEAYGLYCKGRHQLLKWTPDSVRRSIELIEAAIDEEPEFAQAYAALADARAWLGSYGLQRPREAYLQARFSAEKAIALDPGAAEAWATLAHTRALLDWDWAGADRDYRRAFELGSSLADAMAAYAALLVFQDRRQEATAMIDRAMSLDPLSLAIRSQRCIVAAFSGHLEEAVKLAQEILELEPRFARAHWALGIQLSSLGRLEEALAHYEAARAAIGDAPFLLGWHGHCLGLAGRHAEARAIERKLDELESQVFVSEFARGVIRLGRDDRQGALDSFEEACAEHTIWILELKTSHVLRSLAGEPRYHNLLQKLHLE